MSIKQYSGDRIYERENGLLSQWRAYGRDGGFCLVFDTATIAEMLGREFDSHFYVHLKLAPVNYAIDSFNVAGLFPVLLDRLEFFFSEILDGRLPPPQEDGFQPFVEAATLVKHQGFSEERELRIVAMPGSERLKQILQEEHHDFPSVSLKASKMTSGGRRTIVLFDSLRAHLPIKRIIIGPSRDQDHNFNRAREVVGDRIPIVRSATPYSAG